MLEYDDNLDLVWILFLHFFLFYIYLTDAIFMFCTRHLLSCICKWMIHKKNIVPSHLYEVTLTNDNKINFMNFYICLCMIYKFQMLQKTENDDETAKYIHRFQVIIWVS